MTRPSRSKAVLALVVAALFVTPAAAVALPAQAPAESASNTTVQPGAQFAGVVGVQGAEVQGSFEGRAFGQAVAAAASNESKASVVADRVGQLDARLSELRDRQDELRTARQNGSMARGNYQAQMATVAARISQVQEQLNHSQAVATELPAQARERAGLNTEAIETLRSQAREMRGGEVAEVARSIAGKGVGKGVPAAAGGGPPEGIPGNRMGGPDTPGNGAQGDERTRGGPSDERTPGQQDDERTRGNSGDKPNGPPSDETTTTTVTADS